MKKEVKEFLQRVAAQGGQLSLEAQNLLVKEFKEEVLDIFDYKLNNSYDKLDFRKAVVEGDKMRFCHNCYYVDSVCNFINENFNKVDSIIAILKEEIERQENEVQANE